MKIYLSGGYHSGWQDSEGITDISKQAEIINPVWHKGIKDPSIFVPLDLHLVDRADIILAYLEESNPGGQGTLCEIVYAYTKGKTVILVNESLVAP